MQNRNELVKRLIREGDMVAELGVARGDFSRVILETTDCLKLVSVDMWAGDRGHNSTEEKVARDKLSIFDDRSEVVKSTFKEYASLVPASTFDFVYIDGYAHTGQDAGATLDLWWDKVKQGGIFAGHDYHKRFGATIEAVDAFVKKHNLILNLTKEEDKPGIFPSWYVMKTMTP